MNDEIKQEALKVYAEVKDLTIVDPQSYTIAGNYLKRIKTVRKNLKTMFDPMIKAAKDALSGIKGQFDKYDLPLQDAEKYTKQAIAKYDNDQKQKALQEQARLQKQARKEAEDRRLAQAEQLEAQGHTEEANAILDKPVIVPKIVIAPDAKVEGVSSYENWKAEVYNLLELVKAVARQEASIEFVSANMPALNKVAKTLKSTMNVPGVKAISDTVVRSRGE